MRGSEIRNLHLDCLHIYPDGTHRLRLAAGKSRKERVVPIHPDEAKPSDLASCHHQLVEVVHASPADIHSFTALAAEVELWFGPMTNDPEFIRYVGRNIQRGTALIAHAPGGANVLGGLMTGGQAPTYRLNWLVVASATRGQGVGQALVNHAMDRFQRPCRVEVVTFGPDHPAAILSGARAFYERLGFHPGQDAPLGPEGGTRQQYHLQLAK